MRLQAAPWVARYKELMDSSGSWLLPVTGSLLLCLAVLNVMQRRPKNRFAWGYSLNRAAIGALLIVSQRFQGTPPDGSYWLVKL